MHRANYLRKTFKFYNKLLKLQSRCLASAAQHKIVNGVNGEKIIKSPYGDIEYPEIPISEYILENAKNYENLISLVSVIVI